MSRILAAAQTVPVPGDVEANIAEHQWLAEAAAGEHARVVVFPELSLTGYELGQADRLAFTKTDDRLAPLVESAVCGAMTLIVGAPVQIGASLQIGAFILGPDGSIRLYTKHHLGAFPPSAAMDGTVPPAEATVFAAGNHNPLVCFEGHNAAVAICADTSRPSHSRDAADRGARTYLASMFVIPSEFSAEVRKLKACAEGHGMAVVFSNYGGPSGGLASSGMSTIWAEDGRLLAQLGTSGSGLVLAAENDEAVWSAKALRFGGMGTAQTRP